MKQPKLDAKISFFDIHGNATFLQNTETSRKFQNEPLDW